jgi:hypothetical protein
MLDPQKVSKKVTLEQGLNIPLWGVSSTSKVFSKVVLGNKQKKSFTFLWKITLPSFSSKKWSFLRQNIWSTILKDKRRTPIFLAINSKCLKQVSFHCNWPYVNGEFFYTSEKELFQAMLEKHFVISSLTITNWHKHHSSWKSSDNHSPSQNEFIHEELKTMQIFLVDYVQHNKKAM